MSQDNKAIAKRFIEEMVNQGNLDLADELYTDEFSFHHPFAPEPAKGPDGMKQMVGAFRTAFSDLHLEIDDLVAEGDKVALRLTTSGTNDGELMGALATGKRATWSLVHWMTIRDGKIVEDRAVADRMGLMEQLGHLQPQ
jgi:steroid delta-isomerase-like uncharacterized protein